MTTLLHSNVQQGIKVHDNLLKVLQVTRAHSRARRHSARTSSLARASSSILRCSRGSVLGGAGSMVARRSGGGVLGSRSGMVRAGSVFSGGSLGLGLGRRSGFLLLGGLLGRSSGGSGLVRPVLEGPVDVDNTETLIGKVLEQTGREIQCPRRVVRACNTLKQNQK